MPLSDAVQGVIAQQGLVVPRNLGSRGLRQQRVLHFRIVRGEGQQGESMLVHRPRRKEALRVWVYDFTPERMEALKGDLLSLFEGAEPALVGELSATEADAAATSELVASDVASDV